MHPCPSADRDHIARYGGEEFLVLLPGVTEQEAIDMAEYVRENVEPESPDKSNALSH